LQFKIETEAIQKMMAIYQVLLRSLTSVPEGKLCYFCVFQMQWISTKC